MTQPHISIVRNEPALLALAPAWDELETRALAAGHAAQLYASHRYVRLAWQHLRQPGDRLHIVTAHRGERLCGVWPLVSRPQRAAGLPVRVLGPIGIWEGERPGILCETEPDATWAALWAGLIDSRGNWHVLDLRELDEGSWPLRAQAQWGSSLRVQDQADHAAPWQPRLTRWTDHAAKRPAALRDALARNRAALAQRAPEARQVVADDPESIDAALRRFLAIEASHVAGPVPDGLYRLGQDAARVAFYRAFLPMLAARGQAQIRLMLSGDQAIAAVIRLRAGDVWLERHAAEHRDFADLAPAVALLLDTLAQSWDDAAQESDLLLPLDSSGRTAALSAWYDQVRPTRRLTVWNLKSRMALLLPASVLRARLRRR